MTVKALDRASRADAEQLYEALAGDLRDKGTPLPCAAREDLLLVLQLVWNRGYQAALLEGAAGAFI